MRSSAQAQLDKFKQLTSGGKGILKMTSIEDGKPFVELEAEFVLGDGGYELQEMAEVSGWTDTVQGLMTKAFPDDDRPSVHVGIAVLGTSTLVEKFTAEHSWFLDFEKQPDLGVIARQLETALKLVPQLADRLPI